MKKVGAASMIGLERLQEIIEFGRRCSDRIESTERWLRTWPVSGLSLLILAFILVALLALGD